MTQPRAQIEAVRRVVERCNKRNKGRMHIPVSGATAMEWLLEELAAAAEAGEQWPENQIESDKIKQWPKLGPGPDIRAWNDAIERCAQYHDEQEKRFRGWTIADFHKESAAAIRAMKEEEQ